MLTSNVTVYLGKDGLSLNTPLNSLEISGCLPKVDPLQGMINERADLAVFIAEYCNPDE